MVTAHTAERTVINAQLFLRHRSVLAAQWETQAIVITADRAEAISTVIVTVKRLLVLPGPFVRGEFTIRPIDRLRSTSVSARVAARLGPRAGARSFNFVRSRWLITNAPVRRSLKVLKMRDG